MNIIDIIVICLVVLVAIIGYSKGFMHSLLSFIGNLATTIAAFYLATPFSNFLNSIFGLGGAISNGLNAQISTYFTDFVSMSGADVMANHCSASGLLKTAFSLFIKPETIYESDEMLASTLSKFAGNIVTMAISMIIIFILIKVGIHLLAKIFDAISKKSPAINGLDRVLGLILGACKGLIFFAIVCIIASLLQSIPAVANALDTVFTGSNVAKPLYDFITGFVNDYLSKIDFNTLLSGLI